MKSRMIKAVGVIVLAGVLSTSAITAGNYYTKNMSAETVETSSIDTDTIEVSGISSGVTSLIEQTAAMSTTETTVSSGVTSALADAMRVMPEQTGVSETDVDMTAAAQSIDVTIAGYTNLGIASVDTTLNVREAPTTDSSLVGKMPNHSACEILAVEGEWSKIQSGDVTGYVKSEYLLTGADAIALAMEIKQTMATVTTDTLHVRALPNTDCEILTSMPNGETLEVLEDLGDWVKISVDNEEGYISAEYVTLSEDLPKAMTMSEVQYGAGVSDVRVALVQYATQFVGNPYVWGGTSLTRGADCSGFVLSVYANYGISLPHSSRAQANCGTSISSSEAQPGDLFFYGKGSGINHVAIYIGNGQVVHASSPKSGIKISGAYYRNPVKVVRIIN